MKIFEFKKYSRKELATLYDKSPRSFQTWINPFSDEIGPKVGWDYTPAQVKIIVEHIGLPPGFTIRESVIK